MTNNINPNRNNTNNTNRRRGTHPPMAIRRVTRLAIRQQIEQLTQGENNVYAPLITQAYRTTQRNMQELLPNQTMNVLLSTEQPYRTTILQLFALRNGIAVGGNIQLVSAYSDLTAHMPNQIIDENSMNTLLRTPLEQRVQELQMMTLELNIPEQLKPPLRNLYNQILTHTNNQPLDQDTIDELSSLQIVDRFMQLELILNQHRQGMTYAPVA